MLKGYPPERLWWWSCHPERDVPTAGQVVQGQFGFRLPLRLYPQRKFARLKARILSSAWVPLATRHLGRTVARVQPQQIWAILHGWVIPVFSDARLIETHRCHISVWDYQDHHLNAARFGPDGAAHIVQAVEMMYRRSATCDVVSRPMKEDLDGRAGRHDSLVVHSGLEPAQLSALAGAEAEPSPEIRVAYVGGIVARKTFELCIRTMASMRNRLPRPLRVELFGPTAFHLEKWFDPTWMRAHGNLDEVRLNQALRQCQWGFASMDLEDENPRYNRFSLPNKIGTYLAAGLPLLVVGHRQSCTFRLAGEHALGCCLDATDPALLAKEMETSLTMPNSREQFRSAILACVRKEFDAAAIRGALWNCFGVVQ
jgi:glycosyltransferase involved in cell wall biosynthesis